MKIINLPRDGGKTTQAIYLSFSTGWNLVVRSVEEKKEIEAIANKQQPLIKFPEVFTYREFKKQSSLRGKSINGLIIDNLDLFLAESFVLGHLINGASTTLGEMGNFRNKEKSIALGIRDTIDQLNRLIKLAADIDVDVLISSDNNNVIQSLRVNHIHKITKIEY